MPYKGDNDTMIFSYHYRYEKYLRDHNLIDPEKAKMQQERLKKKVNEATEKEKKDKKEGGDGSVPKLPLEGEDLAGDDDEPSYPGLTNSKYRYDQLIKTMIARLEYNNTLAPVQEYGRHQTKALKNKKKKVGAPAAAPTT